MPGYQDLIDLPYYDKVNSSEVGTIFHMGHDAQGNELYILGCRNCGPMVEKTTGEMNRILGIKSEVVMVDTTPCLNIIIKIGGFLSRRLGLIRTGRFILHRGICLAFPKFKELVRNVKQKLDREGADIG